MDKFISSLKTTYTDPVKCTFSVATILGLVAMGALAIYGIRLGIFASSDSFAAYILGLGLIAPLFFIGIQIIQVIIPILPGAIGCVAGVLAFGPVLGFLYSYIGICIGSIIAFLIAKKCGLPTVKKLVSEKQFNKYADWLEKGGKFDKFFALAIFAPVAPDDLLCFLAGLTRISFKKFTLIILLGKPFGIGLYSLCLTGLVILTGF